MYIITEGLDGLWHCELMIQDGWERWTAHSREEAITSMIKGARTLNHGYIREDDITFQKQRPKPPVYQQDGMVLSAEDEKLLREIKSGQKKVLAFDDPILKYRITEKEAEMIVAVREGDAYFNYYQ